MKKLIFLAISMAFSLVSFAAFASPAIEQFTSIAQAKEHCPSLTGLTFVANNPTQYGAGKIIGDKNGVSFQSDRTNELHPKNLNNNNIIGNVKFRAVTVNGFPSFGHISGNKTVCFYSYPGFTGINVGLILETN